MVSQELEKSYPQLVKIGFLSLRTWLKQYLVKKGIRY